MSREMQGMAPRTSQITLQELQTTQQQQIQNQNPQMQLQNSSHFDQSTQDDFIDQMLSNLPSWPELPQNPKSPWELNPPPNPNSSNHQKLFKATRDLSEDPSAASQQENLHYFDESTMLASRLRQHQISENSPKSMMLQQQLLLSRGGGMDNRSSSSGSPAGAAACFGGGNSGFFPLPLTLGSGDSSDSSHIPSGDGSVQGLFNGLTGSLARPGPAPNQQHFHHSQTQNFNAPATGMNQAPPPVGSTGVGGATAPVRQKVRARRGQATDPHSIAERLRRERIAERMKALQELVPNANKTDKASMLDEIIDYVKFLQLQVKVLSMSRLGGAAAVAPLVADMSSEGGGDCVQQASGGVGGRNSNGTQTASPNDNNLTVTEHQVAKLMEEDMGSAMQYLQGKGLCLMPISLASAISTATCHSRNPTHPLLNPEGPSSPNLSVLTVQSATMINGGGESSAKDATSVSKP